MANIKITDLTAYGNPTSTDVLPIVDVGADVTKKVSVADLLENAGSGTAAAPGIAFDGDSNTGIYRPGADQLAVSTNGAGRLFIDSSGNVGLGTSSPTNILHVAGPDNAIVVVQTTTTTKSAGLQLRDSAGNLGTAFTYLSTSDDFRLNHAGSNVFNITSAGNVGIGTTSPQAALDVRSQIYVKGDNTGDGQTGIDIASGASAISTSTHRIRTGGGGGEDFILEAQTDDSEGSISLRANASSGRIVFTTNTSERARIDGSGRLLVGTSSQSGGSLLQVNDDRIRIASSKTPASASDTGTAGEICWDSSYIYVAVGTNTWKRAALSSW